jgi:lysine 2,3-aminomutase
VALIRTINQLADYLHSQHLSLERCNLSYLKNLSVPFPLRVTEHYAQLINWDDSDDPLRKMVIPSPDEENIQEYELSDPIGDHNCEVVPGLIHRYPDRVLLLLTTHCAVHCRYCFRREDVGGVRPIDFQQIVRYLQQHAEIKEIIFSGGDPGTFPAGFLETLFNNFNPLAHVTTYRFHTRVPVADPAIITKDWLNVLQQSPKKIIMVIHANHSHELSVATQELCRQLLQHQVMLLSQSVLLKGVNDAVPVLTELFRKFVEFGIKPYYLHHPDRVKGTHHFRVSIQRGKHLFSSLRGNLSSVCLPEYVLDLPGGKGKVPVMWLDQVSPRTYQARTFSGKIVQYTDYADEPNHN